MWEPLNPTLYRLLQRHFGSVEPVAPGQEIDWKVELSDIARTQQGKRRRLKRRVFRPGEEYRVNCPFCNDSRHRLYINHRWGVYDEATESQNIHLCQCWNETRCLDEKDRQVQLYDLVFAPAPEAQRRGKVRIRPGKRMSSEVGAVEPPGALIPLERLESHEPNHAALVYLRSRGFNPKLLSRRYDISYCPYSKFSLAQNRIIIPIMSRGEMVGWQARYIGDPPKHIPKYWNCPHAPMGPLAYQFDAAVKHPTIIIVEGPTDVWRQGPQAMGLLSSTMSDVLLRRFVAAVSKNNLEPVVAVVLDPKQDELAKRRGKPHHIDVVVSKLRPAFHERVFGWKMPEDSDPGSTDRGLFRSLLKKEAKKHGLRLDFGRPSR